MTEKEELKTSGELLQQISVLLKNAKLSPNILSIKVCNQGGNNRTYQVLTTNGVFVVKKYFREKGDTRDRLAAEFPFLCYAKKVTQASVPMPYAQDIKTGMALYEYIDGKPFCANEISAKEIKQAIEFFCAINAKERKQEALHLPKASEACFTIKAHLDLVSGRIARLAQIQPGFTEDDAAIKLVSEMRARWELLMHEVKVRADAAHLSLSASLPLSDWCLSPSDFGFHNALLQADGRICFLDFEYAGWDDPAKMAGDFFSQLAVPVPQSYFDDFVEQVMQPFAQPQQLVRRAHILRTVYQMKWCCIALNIFIPINLARRQFANPELNVVELKKAQLAKAASLLRRVVDMT